MRVKNKLLSYNVTGCSQTVALSGSNSHATHVSYCYSTSQNDISVIPPDVYIDISLDNVILFLQERDFSATGLATAAKYSATAGGFPVACYRGSDKV